jgi:hypothetical protein
MRKASNPELFIVHLASGAPEKVEHTQKFKIKRIIF